MNHGKAKASKVDDRLTFPLCHVGANGCHQAFDEYRLMDGRDLHIAAGERWVRETAAMIFKAGDWPADLAPLAFLLEG